MDTKVQKNPAIQLNGIEAFVYNNEKYVSVNGTVTLFANAPGAIQRQFANLFMNDTKRRAILRKLGILKFQEAFDRWFFCTIGAYDMIPDIKNNCLVPDAYNSACTDFRCTLRGTFCGTSSRIKGYEAETITALQAGLSISKAASRLYVSIPGMKTRVQHIKNKLEVNNMAQLMTKATKLGL